MNPLIALQGKSFDPVGVEGQVNQNRLTALAAQKGQFDFQQQQDAAARQADMRNRLMSLSGNETPEQVNSLLLRSGNPEAAASYSKTMKEAAAAQAQAGKANREAEGFTRDQALKAIGLMSQTYQSFLKNPNASPEMLADQIVVLTAQGAIPKQSALAELQVLQGIKDPAQFQAHLQQRAQAGLSALEQINATKPTFETVDFGGVKRTLARYPDGRVEVVREDKVSVSPNTAATNSTQLQTTAMQTGSREKIAGAEIASREGEGQKNRDAQAAKDKDLTDAQAKAVLFASRMQEAEASLLELADKKVTTSVPGSRTPYVGPAVNALSSANQQKLDQAKRNFINAVLRRESGAVISDSEFDNAEKQYFPQIGDSAAVIEQKKQNRRTAIDGMKAEIPSRKTGITDTVSNTTIPDRNAASGGDPNVLKYFKR